MCQRHVLVSSLCNAFDSLLGVEAFKPPKVYKSARSDALAEAYVPGISSSPFTCFCSHDSKYGLKISTTVVNCFRRFSEKSLVRPPCKSKRLPIRCATWRYRGRGSYLQLAMMQKVSCDNIGRATDVEKCADFVLPAFQ